MKYKFREPVCKNCRYWEEYKTECFGRCKRFPPQAIGDNGEFGFPNIFEDKLCGEFRYRGINDEDNEIKQII